ncbi:glycosyltransferase [Nocardioides cavernae]|uniref:Glycosyltransferase n=1 Tax=Nocardioides cavernae TaxID=1921566 RepID=A0ABR8NHM6_9ACTN|nr:glycosyltransferase [Nocardioides cavernae]MBD3926655.1 glycosyltransferase [Nocardioides cavernae]MBM7512377.1 glycosyltransferase involved in cell wall biosynthesis [Nocardioides cavernae]
MLEVFIPFWGDPGYLRDAVASVRAQTDPHWRLVVVDDCYPDPTVPEFFETLDDPRIRYVRNDTNLGITDNYRRCLDLASESWIVFLGCDDLMLPDYVATMTAAIADAPEQVHVIQPGVRVVDERGGAVKPLVDRVKRRFFAPRVTESLILSGERLATSLLRGNWTYWPSLALRTEVVRAHPFLDGLPLVQDLALLVDMSLSGSQMLVLPDEVFAYRRHSASASSATVVDGGRFAGERDYFAIAADTCTAHGWHTAARAARIHAASRLYAVSQLPVAVRHRSWASARTLAAHATRTL